MKKELNMVINKSGVKIEEVSLFREMSKQFNNYPVSRSTYVEEIHGRKGWVQFASGYKTGGQPAQKYNVRWQQWSSVA